MKNSFFYWIFPKYQKRDESFWLCYQQNMSFFLLSNVTLPKLGRNRRKWFRKPTLFLFLPKGCNEASVWYQQILNQFFSQWYLREMVVSGEYSSVAKLIFTVFPHFHPRMRKVRWCGDRSGRWGEAAPERTVRRATGMLCSAESGKITQWSTLTSCQVYPVKWISKQSFRLQTAFPSHCWQEHNCGKAVTPAIKDRRTWVIKENLSSRT